MTRVALLLAVILLAGCGSHSAPSPEDVARAWSAALNRDDNEAAAKLFAARPEIVQGTQLPIMTRGDVLDWTASLPCGGRITRVERRGKAEVLVVFTLTERPHHICDGPGKAAAAIFGVEDGKIVLWHQTPVPAADEPASTGPVI